MQIAMDEVGSPAGASSSSSGAGLVPQLQLEVTAWRERTQQGCEISVLSAAEEANMPTQHRNITHCTHGRDGCTLHCVARFCISTWVWSVWVVV
jgi:hypothetical protein